ncbi:interactor protein for cytohesin exchange factors 1 isoform x5 [Limosa lapponica baueri]|uniref:Interactor protein for cytohesin exchange factors 1 isoform x5 n=1 Tax=Limosa lapponica baueri TaxID=1758121 RepID=A0A2I0U844_LIMLA|nr:interactor protein for cytohesin exchange factors 1 isoform x5 [Limosa lapponica baueri]
MIPEVPSNLVVDDSMIVSLSCYPRAPLLLKVVSVGSCNCLLRAVNTRNLPLLGFLAGLTGPGRDPSRAMSPGPFCLRDGSSELCSSFYLALLQKESEVVFLSCLQVPLRQKTKKKSQGFFIMSRRRISCKELGQADCQGWLYKKKEKGAFIGNKWKKFWCVLKESSLYWYSSQLAEKAEGFIRLPDFSVDRAIECKKKHTFNSQESSSSLTSKVVYSERQSWLDLVNSSATEEGDQPLTFCVQINSDELPEADCGEAAESQEVQLSKPNGGSQNSFLGLDTHCLAVPDATGQRSLAKDQEKCDDDEMERLYKSLEQASLSPIGDRRLSTKKELRKSFIKRSKNPSINEKLHKIRMLNSTLKCKEHDLATINQLLEDPKLTAMKYREWRNTNIMLVQDIYQQQEVQDVSTENSEEQEMTSQPIAESAI